MSFANAGNMRRCYGLLTLILVGISLPCHEYQEEQPSSNFSLHPNSLNNKSIETLIKSPTSSTDLFSSSPLQIYRQKQGALSTFSKGSMNLFQDERFFLGLFANYAKKQTWTRQPLPERIELDPTEIRGISLGIKTEFSF